MLIPFLVEKGHSIVSLALNYTVYAEYKISHIFVHFLLHQWEYMYLTLFILDSYPGYFGKQRRPR